MDIYYSSDFQCPDTGIPVILVYDAEYQCVTADIDWSQRHAWEELAIDNIEEILSDTNNWCKKICKNVESLDEANDIADKYDCWF